MTENSPTKVAWTSPRKVFQDLSPAQNIVNNDLFDKDIFDKEELKSKSEFHTAENTPIKQCTIENIEYVQRRSINKSSSESPKLNESKSDCSVYDSPKSVKATDQMDHIIRLFKKFNVHSPVSPKEGTANNESTSQNRLLEQIDENSTANSNFYDALDVRELEEASNQTTIINNNFKDSLENLSIQIDDESNFDSLKSSASKENNRESYENTSLETDSLNKNTLPSFEEVFKIPEKIHQVPTTFDNKYSDIENVDPSNFRASVQSVDSTFSLDSLNDGNEEISKIKSRNFHEQLPELNFDNGLENYLIDGPSNSNEFSPNQNIKNSNPSVLSELISDQEMEEFLINERKIRTEWNYNEDKSEFLKNNSNDIETNMRKVILSSPKMTSVQNVDSVTEEILTERSNEIIQKTTNNSEFSHFEAKLEDPHLKKISHRILNENKSLSESIHESAINETFDSKTNLIGNEQIEFENLQFEDRWENVIDHIEIETELNKTINLDKTKNMDFESTEKLNNSSGNFIETPIQNSTLIISEQLSSATKDLPLEKELIFENSQSILQQSLLNKMLDVTNTIENFENITETSPNLINKNSEPTIYLESSIQNEEVKQSSDNASIETVQVNIPNSTENTFVSCTDSAETVDVKNETLKNISKNIDSMENSFESCVETHEIINQIEDIHNEVFQNITNKTVQQHMVKICEEDVTKSIESIKPIETTSVKDVNVPNSSPEMPIISDKKHSITTPNKTLENSNTSDKSVINQDMLNTAECRIENDFKQQNDIKSNEQKTLNTFINDALNIENKIKIQENLEMIISTDNIPNKTIEDSLSASFQETMILTEQVRPLKTIIKESNHNIIESNDLFKENSFSSVNKTLDFSIELPADDVRNENINNQETTEIMSEIQSSNDIPKENMTTVVNKTLDLTADTHSISFSDENECIEKENSETSKSTAIICSTGFNYTSSENLSDAVNTDSDLNMSNEIPQAVIPFTKDSEIKENIERKSFEKNVISEPNKNLDLNINECVLPLSNEKVTNEDMLIMKSTEIIYKEDLINKSDKISAEIFTKPANKSLETNIDESVPVFNENILQENNEKMKPNQFLYNEGLNSLSNEVFKENSDTTDKKLLNLNYEPSETSFSNQNITRESVDILKPTEIVYNKELNNSLNEISEENLTLHKKTMDTSSNPSATTISNKPTTKENIELVCNESLDITSNEKFVENLTTGINKTIMLDSESYAITISNETIRKEDIQIGGSESLNNTLNQISEENLTIAVNKTLDLSSNLSLSPISTETITKKDIEIVCSKSLHNISNEIFKQNLATVNKTMELSTDTCVTPITNRTITEEDIEIVCNENLNKTSNEISEENLTTDVNKTLELSSNPSMTTISNETITKEGIEIVCNENLNKTSNEISKENLTIDVNKTLELSSDPSMTTITNETITKEDIEIVYNENLNKTSNEISEENLTTDVNKTLELSSDPSMTTISNETITKEGIETVCNENLNKTSNEISEENLTTDVNKTLELSSDPSMITITNETITKEDIEIVYNENLNKTSNEISEENLTTDVNKTLELSSDPSMTTIFNETITKEGIEIDCTENFINTSNEMSEDNLISAVNKTMELSSDPSVDTISNVNIAKKDIKIVCRENLNTTTNIISEGNLTIAVNTTMELDSSANTVCKESVIKEDIQIVSGEPINNISNEISEENLTTTVNKTMELNSEPSAITMSNETVTKHDIETFNKTSNEISQESLTTAVNKTLESNSDSSMTIVSNETITKEANETVCTESLNNTTNVISEENLTIAVNTTMELDSSANTVCNESVRKEDIEIVSGEPINNISNEISEENLTTTVNKTMELNSEPSAITMSNETVTKHDIETLEISQESLTTAVNKTLESNSDLSMTTILNETIAKQATETVFTESLNNTTNVISEENLTIAVNTTLELDSESSANTVCNETVTKEDVEIVSGEPINNISNEIPEENLTTTVNKPMELNSEPCAFIMSNEPVTKDDIETFNTTSNKISQENLTTVANKTLESNSDSSLTIISNETITKEANETVCTESLNNTTNGISEENLTIAVNTTLELDSESSANTVCNETVTKEDVEIVSGEPINNISNEISEENLTTTVNKTMELNSEPTAIAMSNETVTKDDIESFNKTSNEISQENLTTAANKTLESNSDPSMTTISNETIIKEANETVCSESINNTTNVISEENLTIAVNATMELDSESSANTICNETVTKEGLEIVCGNSLNNISNETSDENLTTVVDKTMELHSKPTAITISNEVVAKDDIETVCNESINKTSNEISQDNLTRDVNKTLELSSDSSMTAIFNETIRKEAIETVCSENFNNTKNVISEENSTIEVNKTMELNFEPSATTISNETIAIEKVQIVCSKSLNNTSNEIFEENLITAVNKTMDLSSDPRSALICNNMSTVINNDNFTTANIEIMEPIVCDEDNKRALNKNSELNFETSLSENSKENIEIMKPTDITCIESFNKISSETSETNLTGNTIPSECNEKSEINVLSTKNNTSKLETITQSESNEVNSVVSKIDIHGSGTKLPLNISVDKTDNIIKFSMNSKVPTNSSNQIDNQKLTSQNQNSNLKVVNEDGLNVSAGLNLSSCSSELSKTLVEKNDETPYTASSPNNVQSKVENNKRIDLPDPIVQNTVINQDQIDKLRIASNNTDSPQYFYSGQSTKATNKLTPSQNSPSYCFDIFESSVTKLNLAEVHGNSVKKCRNNKTEIKISSEDINVDKCLNILTPIDKENLHDDFKNIDDLSITNKKLIIEPILHEDNIKNKLSLESIPIEQIVTNLQNNVSNMNSTNIVDIQTKQQVSNIDESLSIRNQLESDKTNIQTSLNNTPPKASCSNTSAEEVFVSPRGFSWGSFFGKSSNEGTFREPRPSTIKLFDPLLNSSPRPTSTMKTNNNSASSQHANINDCKTTNLLTILNENIMGPPTSNSQTQQFQVDELNPPNIEDNLGKINIEKSKPTESIFSPLPKPKQSTSVVKIEPDEKTKDLHKLKRQLESLNKLAEINDYESLDKILKQTNELVLLFKYRCGYTNENLQNIIKDTEDRTYKKQKGLNQLELQLQSELDKNKNLQDETIIARNHLSKCEDALNDVQEKYQTMRERIIRYQQSETEMLKIIDDQVIKGDELNENYSSHKKQAIQDLEKLNGIYHKTKHDHETESLALQGRIRREQLLNASLENEIKRKTEECQRLSEMCDEILLKKK